MTNISCLLAGLTRLLSPLILVQIWHNKTGARRLPAIIAFIACFPVFITGAVVRSGFSHSDFYSYYIQQGLLYGILEETAKFLVLKYYLTSYTDTKDAVTYGIGHGAFEEFGAGMSCLWLIGTGRAASGIFWVNLWSAAEGTAFVVGLTVLIFYGIRTNKSQVMLPLAIMLHTVSNAFTGIFGFSGFIVITFNTLMTAGICFAAYKCWVKLESN